MVTSVNGIVTPKFRHSGAERSEEPGIHNPSAGAMDSGLAASRQSGVTKHRHGRNKSGHDVFGPIPSLPPSHFTQSDAGALARRRYCGACFQKIAQNKGYYRGIWKTLFG